MLIHSNGQDNGAYKEPNFVPLKVGHILIQTCCKSYLSIDRQNKTAEKHLKRGD